MYSDSQVLANNLSHFRVDKKENTSVEFSAYSENYTDGIVFKKQKDGRISANAKIANTWLDETELATKSDLPIAPISLINGSLTDWNAINKPGWYSGDGTAKNSPSGLGATDWLNVTVFASHGNSDYLTLSGLRGNRLYQRERKGDNGWGAWSIYTLTS